MKKEIKEMSSDRQKLTGMGNRSSQSNLRFIGFPLNLSKNGL